LHRRPPSESNEEGHGEGSSSQTHPSPTDGCRGYHVALRFEKLHLAGWKSIREAAVEFNPLNVLIGANGSGKSNLIGFFKLLNEMIAGRLQVHVAQSGDAESLLHLGVKQTKQIQAELVFTTEAGRNRYRASFVPATPTGLVFEQERIEFWVPGFVKPHDDSWTGHRESRLSEAPSELAKKTEFFRDALLRCRVFHFHDTSNTAAVRKPCSVEHNRQLDTDAGNLPAVLYLYQQRHPTSYRRIVAAVRAVAPFFDDFVLEPRRLDPTSILLEWRATESAHVFGPHQMSDGTLRAVALFTLLLQPEQDLPEMIVLDEPELGLHPAALAVLADLLKGAARNSQLLIATQSAALLDHFEAEDVITVNLRDGCSTFERLDADRLKPWLEEYALSNLWERNVIAGGPY
jgi:predicted ATPase